MHDHPKPVYSSPFEGPTRIVGCTYVTPPKFDLSAASLPTDNHPPDEPGALVVFLNCTLCCLT